MSYSFKRKKQGKKELRVLYFESAGPSLIPKGATKGKKLSPLPSMGGKGGGHRNRKKRGIAGNEKTQGS